jgi:hypothetical protein
LAAAMTLAPPIPRRHRWLGITVCAVLLTLFFAFGYRSVQVHSPTIDEPVHSSSGYFIRFDRDFRVDPEHPPLWKYWAMLPNRHSDLRSEPERALWEAALQDVRLEHTVAMRQMFQVPGNDGAALINRSRVMMLLIGVALGACVAAWSYQLAGPAGAVVSCALFAFDPNMLAHSPLVKNDVALTWLMFATAWAAWSVGKSARWWNLGLLVVACAAAPCVKFSGVVVAPMLAIILLARAMLPQPWHILWMELGSRLHRVVAVMGICAAALVVTVGLIWACYGFRFDPTPLPGARFNVPAQIREIKQAELFVRSGCTQYPSEDQIDSHPTSLLPGAILAAEQHRLLPQSWLFGLAFTCKSTAYREAYLLGQVSNLGWWYYFPLAMLFKTPLATLAATAAALWALLSTKSDPPRWRHWTNVCLMIPLLGYACLLLTSRVDIGLRYALPVYPFLFVLVGMGFADWMRTRPRRSIALAAVLGVCLAVESLASYPHHLSFFNLVSRPFRFHLLSDSNFDWGQDLLYVRDWQQRNPGTPLYLGYLGSVDPAVYGIRYINIPGGFRLNPDWQWPPTRPGVIAISATLLQGINCPIDVREFYVPLRERQPKEVLGDTIYLYDWPLR